MLHVEIATSKVWRKPARSSLFETLQLPSLPPSPHKSFPTTELIMSEENIYDEIEIEVRHPFLSHPANPQTNHSYMIHRT